MHDFRGLFVWERLKTLVLFYPLALGVIVLLGWPTSYVLAAPASPPLPVWSVLLATLVAGYEVLRTAAHTASRPDDVQPADWIRYAHAPPVAVLAGKLLAALAQTSCGVPSSLHSCSWYPGWPPIRFRSAACTGTGCLSGSTHILGCVGYGPSNQPKHQSLASDRTLDGGLSRSIAPVRSAERRADHDDRGVRPVW